MTTRTLRGDYALFIKGQRRDEPVAVANDAQVLQAAGEALFGDGHCLVMLWESADDRTHALARLETTRTAGS